MPILERTPPVRRAPVGADNGLETSSPSRAKLDRNGGDKQSNAAANEGEYVFPPLDAMASAVREKNLGMSMSGRYTPTMSRGGENQGASGGLRGSTSGGSGRRLLGAGGRNAPVLTATAGKVHPPLGSTSCDYDERPIRGAAVVSMDQATTSGGTDSRAFEAQMERALASGANPFQDRKRDQMRGDSSIVVAARDSPQQQQVKSPQWHSPRTTTRMEEARPQADMVAPVSRSPAPARKPTHPEAYKPSTPTKARLTRPRTPDSERKREKQALVRLQEDIAAKTLQVEKAQAEAYDAKRSLSERKKSHRQQIDRIKGLEREVKQLQVVKSKANDEDSSMAKLMVISTSWEVSRISFITGLSKAQEMRERDVEAVIYRNEVTYMDARRAEAQLELEDERTRAKELVAVVKEMRREEERIQARVQVLEESKEESERRNAGAQASQDQLLAEIETGRKERAAVEKELRLMKMKYEEERERTAKAKDELLFIEKQLTKERSSQRRNRDEADAMETPIQQERKQKQKVTADTKKQHQQQQKETIEAVRQSPRKAAISAAIKSTISSVRGASGSKNIARQEEEQQQGMDTFDDFDVAPLAASKVAKKVVEAKKTTARQKTPTEERDDLEVDEADSGDDYKTEKKPAKKSSILSRRKKPLVKEGGVKGAKGKKAIDDDAEMQRQVEQTPMIVNKKKRKPSVTGAEEEEEEPENSMNIDATPVVKLKAKTSKEGGKPMQELDEDRSLIGTRTPMVPTKRSALGAGIAQHSAASATAKTATTTTTEVKKKKRRLLKPNTNVANNFFSANGDEEGDLDPKLNLPLQLSPVKVASGEGIMTSSSSTLLGGKRGMSAAASRVFRR